jgi:hypothetical protein
MKPTTIDIDHRCTEECCPRGTYYVSAVDGPSWWRMAGPYNTHQEALADVERARSIAVKHDGRAWFMGWGTIRDREGKREPGNLNRAGLM